MEVLLSHNRTVYIFFIVNTLFLKYKMIDMNIENHTNAYLQQFIRDSLYTKAKTVIQR